MNAKVIHPTMQRVYEATGVTGSVLASSINEFSQTIYNWDRRGISKDGALVISKKYGINLSWILTGEGSPVGDGTLIKKENSLRDIKDGGLVPVKVICKFGEDGYYSELKNTDETIGYVHSFSAGLNAYAIKVTSDFYYPVIRNGWFVVCDPDKQPTPTEFVEVILIDERRIIMELIGVVNNLLHLLSINDTKRLTIEMVDVKTIIAITDIVPPSQLIS